MKKEIIIFGTGIVSDAISEYIKYFNNYKIVAYCTERKFINKSHFRNLPVIDLDQCFAAYSSEEYYIFVAIGYHDLGKKRKEIFEIFLNKGYRFPDFLTDEIKTLNVEIGRNTFIMPGAIVQPKVKIGDNVLVWGNALVGHHVKIGSHTWITGGVSIGGSTTIGECCFLGINSTIGPNINIGDFAIIGANTLTTKSLESNKVVVNSDSPIHRLSSSNFAKLSKSLL